MRNRLPGGLEVVPAAVEIRPSLADGDPAVIFDYKGMQKKATQFAEVAFTTDHAEGRVISAQITGHQGGQLLAKAL